jgi:hypothetical protein
VEKQCDSSNEAPIQAYQVTLHSMLSMEAQSKDTGRENLSPWENAGNPLDSNSKGYFELKSRVVY